MKIFTHRFVFVLLSALVIMVTLLGSASPAFAEEDGTAPYTIKQGEKITHIAERFGLTIAKIALYNPSVNLNDLRTGQVITLPPGRSEGLVAADKAKRIYVWQRERDGGRVEKDDHLYLAKNGDNLTRIAKAYGVTLARLLEVNPQIEDPNTLYRGELVKIPDGRAEFVPPFYETPKPVAGEKK